MMGSRGRAALVRRQLLEAGIDAERVEALYAPIGLSIGSQTAEEIALSILAQIVSIKNARPQTEGFSSALLEAMAQTDAAGQQAVLAVIAARHGSTPREIGAKCWFAQTALLWAAWAAALWSTAPFWLHRKC